MVQLHRHADDFEARGAELVIIGNGAPNFIAGFREHTGYDGDLYTDPSRALYRALELRRSFGSTFHWRGVGRAMSAFRRGFRQRRTQGDPWQQGGVFVIGTDGAVRMGHRSEYAGDHPPVAAILGAL